MRDKHHITMNNPSDSFSWLLQRVFLNLHTEFSSPGSPNSTVHTFLILSCPFNCHWNTSLLLNFPYFSLLWFTPKEKGEKKLKLFFPQTTPKRHFSHFFPSKQNRFAHSCTETSYSIMVTLRNHCQLATEPISFNNQTWSLSPCFFQKNYNQSQNFHWRH